jgi:integrase
MHLRKLPSGNWQVIVQHDGRKLTATAPSRADAVRAGANMLVDLGDTPRGTQPHVSVRVVIDEHIDVNRPRWSAQYTTDCTRVTALVGDELLERRASTVQSADIAALYRRLARAGISTHRLQRLHGLLSGAFRRAVTNGWVRSNPCTGVTPDMPTPARLTIPTAAQVAEIVAAAPEGPRRLFLRVAAITGARRGELVAIQWDDINPARCELVIRRARSVDGTGVPYTHDGKTGRRGHRVLTLDPGTIELLDTHRTVQAVQAELHELPTPVWVFSIDAGVTPWPPDMGTSTFSAARDAAKIPGVRLHDLRHYVATSMLQDGETPIDVANQLGDTIQTVLRTYAHFMPGRGADAARRRAATLG